MTEKQKYAIKLAIDTMDKYVSRYWNTSYGSRKTGVSVGYGEAINILSDMVRDNDSKQTNADRIRNMSDEELLDFICSIETYEEGSIKTIENGTPMHTVTEVREWLQSEAKETATNMENLDVRR